MSKKLWQDCLTKTASITEALHLYKEASVEYRGRTFPGYNQPIASDKKNKKKMVLAKKDGKVKLVHFGQKGYKHNYSKSAKKNYLTRSAGIRNKSGELTMNDKHSPNYWARKHLWPKRQKADGSALKKEAGFMDTAKKGLSNYFDAVSGNKVKKVMDSTEGIRKQHDELAEYTQRLDDATANYDKLNSEKIPFFQRFNVKKLRKRNLDKYEAEVAVDEAGNDLRAAQKSINFDPKAYDDAMQSIDDAKKSQFRARAGTGVGAGLLAGGMLLGGGNGTQNTEKVAEKREKKEKPLLARALGTAAGTGMVLGSTPVVSAMANPYHNVYHGTNLNSADLIFNNELDDGFKGLSTRFAGQAGRLNEKMLANTAIKSMYDLGIPLTEDQEIDLVDSALSKMNVNRGTGRFNSVDAVMESAREQLSKNLKPEEVDSVLSSIKDNVVKSGKRIYTSTGPATVSEWATTDDEALIALKNMKNQVKMQAKTIGNLLTGGLFPELSQRYRNFKFNRAANKVKSNVTREQTGKLLQALNKGEALTDNDLAALGINRKEYDRLVDLAGQGRLGTSIGTRLPVGESAMLNDFPGLNVAMAANPGLKHSLADYLPNMDPSRDLSVSEDIPIENFRSLDIVDTKTGKPIRRLMLDSPNTPKVTLKGMAKGLRNASPYAAIGALGADVAQANLLNREMYTGRGLSAMYNRMMGKEASIFSGSTKRGLEEAYSMAKGLAPAVGLGTLAGLGADAAVGGVIDKMRGTEAYKDQVDALTAQNSMFGMAANEARLAAEAGVRASVASPLALGGALGSIAFIPKKHRKALGAIKNVIGGKALPSELMDHTSGLASLAGSSYLGGLIMAPVAAQMSANISEGGDLSTVSPLLAPIEDTAVGDFMKEKAPGLAATVPIGAVASLPVLGAYAGRKYYGGHLSKLNKATRQFRDHNIGSFLRELDASAVDRIESSSKRAKLKQLLRDRDLAADSVLGDYTSEPAAKVQQKIRDVMEQE